MEVKKADLYYGSLLSVMVNNELTPAIMEQGDKRNIYKVTTNNGDYVIFTKYRVLSKGKSDILNWNFAFSESEIEEIKKYEAQEEKFLLAFVCVSEEESFKSEITLLYPEEFRECVYMDGKYEGSQRLNVKYTKGSRGLKVYGIKRADVLNGKDNTIRVERDRLVRL